MTEEGRSPLPPGEGPRQYLRYLFWSLSPEWRRLSAPRRRAQLQGFAARLESPPEGLQIRTYSLLGTKARVHGLLWMIADRLDSVAEFESSLLGLPVGGYLETPYAYFGLSRRSEYLGGHSHTDQEGGRVRPSGRPYLFVYPFVKKREWYGLPFEERRRIMGEHFRIGHRFPNVTIHTGYSFGLDDAEFILAFEAESPGEFLDLVEALRGSEASRYTALETPIFTCRAAPVRRMLALAAGRP